MKKLILMVILGMVVMSCELFDKQRWERINREDAERGVRCYRDGNGYAYCKDKYGNRTY